MRKEWNSNCHTIDKDFSVLLAIGRQIDHSKYILNCIKNKGLKVAKKSYYAVVCAIKRASKVYPSR